MSFRNL